MSCDTVRRRHNHPQAGSVFERGAIRKHAQYLNEEPPTNSRMMDVGGMSLSGIGMK